MLSAAAAWGYLREEKDAKTGMAALIALCVVFSGYTMQTMVQRAPELEKETYTDTRIGQFEYTYPCTEKTALKVGDVRTSQPGVCNVLSYEKRGTELTATVQLEGEAAYIELPLLYYPGYRAEIDGQAQTVARGTNNMVRVYGLSSGESGTVHVWYQPPTAWLIAQGASVLGALLLAASLRRMPEARMTELRASVRQVVEFSLHERDLSPAAFAAQAHAGGRGGAQGAAKRGRAGGNGLSGGKIAERGLRRPRNHPARHRAGGRAAARRGRCAHRGGNQAGHGGKPARPGASGAGGDVRAHALPKGGLDRRSSAHFICG